MVLSLPMYALWTYHRRKMEEIRSSRDARIAEQTQAALVELRREIESLRDTTTQYDVSFDTALQRIDSRLNGMEARLRTLEHAPQEQRQSGP